MEHKTKRAGFKPAPICDLCGGMDLTVSVGADHRDQKTDFSRLVASRSALSQAANFAVAIIASFPSGSSAQNVASRPSAAGVPAMVNLPVS